MPPEYLKKLSNSDKLQAKNFTLKILGSPELVGAI